MTLTLRSLLRQVRIKPLTATAAALIGFASFPANADTYDLSGSITSFRSWIVPGTTLHPLLGSTALTDSGVVAGTDDVGRVNDWSDKVSVNAVSHGPSEVASIDFGYDPAVSAARRLNGFSVKANQAVFVEPGHFFDLATLTFTNGQYFYKAEVGLHFVATDRGTGARHVFDGVAAITSVSSTPHYDPKIKDFVYDPYAEADFFDLEGFPGFGSVRVFEAIAQPPGNPGSTGSAILRAKIGSLDPVGFADPTGGAFLDSSVVAALADPHGNMGAVPEPSTWAMLLAGFAVLGFAGWRARRGKAARAA